jgi:hypothetical protein
MFDAAGRSGALLEHADDAVVTLLVNPAKMGASINGHSRAYHFAIEHCLAIKV